MSLGVFRGGSGEMGIAIGAWCKERASRAVDRRLLVEEWGSVAVAAPTGQVYP